MLMVKAYAATLERSLDTITRWVEKTPANFVITSTRPHSVSACKNSDHATGPARHSRGANRAGENKADRTVLYLLRHRALAGGCETGQARPRRGSSWDGRPVRTAGE